MWPFRGAVYLRSTDCRGCGLDRPARVGVPRSIRRRCYREPFGAARYTVPTMIDFTPNPIALAIGSIEIRWYGIGYVAAILAGMWLTFRLARQRGEPTERIIDGLIIMAIAALIGGRAYHVIDQWAYYQDHLAQIVLPPYSGLGIYGGLLTGMLAMIWYARRHHLNFWRWGDIVVPGVLIDQDRPASVQWFGHLRRIAHRHAGNDLVCAPPSPQLLAMGRHRRPRRPDRPSRRSVGQLHEPGAVRPADQPALGYCD